MANDIGRAMARLKHRDIRTRRRAVRTLFEHDDAAVLEAFKPLLDDQDSWFVSKALDAYRMWGITAGSEAISVLLRHSNLDVRRAGANLLTPLGEAGKELAIEALTDEDGVVQRKAAKALLRFDEATAAATALPDSALALKGNPNNTRNNKRYFMITARIRW